jgi:GNAT superfamily N-acetyltransferase
MELWNRIINEKDHHIIVAEEDGKIVSSCVCVIIPNFTHNQRPYAFVENVITDEEYRGKGLATKCLDYAKEIALKENCYKLMLLTGSKKESTLNFYRQAGYNSEDKTAFIQWI